MDPITLCVALAVAALIAKPFRWTERASDAVVGAGQGVRQGWTSTMERTRPARPVRGGHVQVDTGHGTPLRGGRVPTDMGHGGDTRTGTPGHPTGHVHPRTPGQGHPTGTGTPHAPTDDMRDRATTRVHRAGWGGYRTGWGVGVLGVATAEATRHGIRGAREAWRHGRTVTPEPDAETAAVEPESATPEPVETEAPSGADPPATASTSTDPETAPTPEETPPVSETTTAPTGTTAGSDQTHTSVQQSQQQAATSLSDGGMQQHLQQATSSTEGWMQYMTQLRAQAVAIMEDGETFGAGVRRQAAEQVDRTDQAAKILSALLETLGAATRAVGEVAEGAAQLMAAAAVAVGG